MPMLTVHCKVCKAPIRGETFPARMALLRRHYKAKHPKLWRKSIQKGVRARAKTRKA